MDILEAFAGIVAVAISWIVGGRLMILSRRTRQAPELLVGAGLLLMGGLWNPLVAIGRQATQLADPLREGLVVAGALCAIVGTASMALFISRVFRPGVAWARALVILLALGLLAAFAGQGLGSSWPYYVRHESGPWLVATWLVVATYGWGGLEAWRQHRMFVRRRALGLVDPVVADRLRLWVWTMASAFLAAGMAGVCQARGIPMVGTAIGLFLTLAVAPFAAGCMWFAFIPPASYLAWVRRRAGAAA